MATAYMTTVRLCRAVPLDNSYKDTITFSTAAQQLSYFTDKTYLIATELSYQREHNMVRYGADYDSVIQCNYLCYQNKSYNDKWFYAFITRIEYVNDGMCDIYFEIDSYQTFMFDITINSAFVEREHVNDDTPGANILPEPVDEGIYSYAEVTMDRLELLQRVWYLLGASSDWGGGTIAKYYNNIFSGLDLYCFSNDDQGRTALQLKIVELEAKKQGSVQWIAAIPQLSIDPYVIDATTGEIQSSENVGMAGFQLTHPTTAMTSGYTPRNKKLLSYPFSYFTVSNMDGQIKEYHYEDFFDLASNIVFTWYADLSNSPTIRCTPLGYQGNQFETFDAGLTLNWGTQISWITDVYKQWLQANQVNFATKQISTILQGAIGLSTGSPTAILGSLTGAFNTAMGVADSNYQMNLKANKVTGSQGGNFLDVALSLKHFVCYQIALRPTDAQRIDAFFDRYGYQVNYNKVPNVTGRRYWNYVKCRAISITGNCPVEHIAVIKNMFLNGVTFWHSNRVGDYSQINDIV